MYLIAANFLSLNPSTLVVNSVSITLSMADADISIILTILLSPYFIYFLPYFLLSCSGDFDNYIVIKF